MGESVDWTRLDEARGNASQGRMIRVLRRMPSLVVAGGGGKRERLCNGFLVLSC
jgi:hypothetical protein